jgi:hypothetical protein
MAMDLEKERKKVELIRVRAARAELEFKILERQDEIERIKQNIQAQLNREADLEKELGE